MPNAAAPAKKKSPLAEVWREMAALARDYNNALVRIVKLESRLAELENKGGTGNRRNG